MNTKYDIIIGIVFLLVVIFTNRSYAGLNPCEYMNLQQSSMNQIDTGHDENFERIKQQNNRALVISCQEYIIKLNNTMKNDLNRDNY